MSDLTPLLGLPYILPSQAQKHVTHNEALALLDAVVQLAVQARNLSTPPTNPQEGARYIVAAGGSLEWAGHDGEVAVWRDAGWHFVSPLPGWQAQDLATGEAVGFDGSDWVVPQLDLNNLDGMGIGTSWDATNRLAVTGDATLLSHDGAGHQLKINKAFSTDTASLLFQTGWSGRAEMGTAGSDRFTIKTSADGASWVEALSFASATGIASGQAIQQSRADVTAGRLMRADYGYGPGNLLGTVGSASGVPTGAVIERGSNANGEYVRFADGTQICWQRLTNVPVTTAVGGLFRSDAISWTFPASFVLGNTNGATIFGRVGSINGISFNAPYGARTTVMSDARAYASTSLSSTEIYITAIGRWT